MAGARGWLLVGALAGFVAAPIARSTESIQATSQTGELASTLGISNMLFKDFVYPFELTSFLILVAVLGATVLAQREKSLDGADKHFGDTGREPVRSGGAGIFFQKQHHHHVFVHRADVERARTGVFGFLPG